MHLGSWRRDPSNPERWLSYGEIAPQLVAYCMQMGFTHVQLLPVSEHPFTAAGVIRRPVTMPPRAAMARRKDFMQFCGPASSEQHRCDHRLGAGPLPKDDHGLRQFDGTSPVRHADPQKGEHPDWGTLNFQLRPQ